ncbi:MAG: ribonuclease R [Gammaproteobacteria bacterium]|nr:ribonuclease R [Gammaproteobacteria bacterium]
MSKKNKDPYFEREKEKYADPIPSREFIMQVLAEYGQPIHKKDLFQLLGLRKKEQQETLMYRLKAMIRDGQLFQDRKFRWCLRQKTNLVKGRIQAQAEGFGFFIPEDGGSDMVLSAREMRRVMHGDIVLAYEMGVDRRGRPEAKVTEVLQHAIDSIAGRFISREGVFYVEPEHKFFFHDILIPADAAMGAKDGQMVIVKIVEYPSKHGMSIGRVDRVLGDYMGPGLEIEVAILNYGIPNVWPTEVLSEMHLIPKVVREKDLVGRKDLRELPFVTIDGDDAKDFDDAVCCKALARGDTRLWVAIADVSHYVAWGSPIDEEAAIRGNSVYFPGRVVPMLPEALSNGICSLNPNVDRLCMVAEMVITAKGQIREPKFYRAVIHSKNRLIYDHVAALLEQNDAPELSSEVWAMLQQLQKVYESLKFARLNRGAIELDSIETKVVFDKQLKIEKITPVVRNEAHRIIEECMLAANVAVASFIASSGVASMYRVHEAPDIEKMKSLQTFLGEFGIQCGFSEKVAPKRFQEVLEKIRLRPEKQVLETIMLRSLKQAHYAIENSGHFGLGYEVYTHFTSPIRRYPDLMVHRILGEILDRNQDIASRYPEKRLAELAEKNSMTERRADEATRDVMTWLKCIYIKDKVGQTFPGTISAVTSFGLFVSITDIYVEGLVHVSSLKSDYYQFDAMRHRLVGERTNQIYHLGDPLTVLVARVDPDARKIDFELVTEDVEKS